MIRAIVVRERGPSPGQTKTAFNKASRRSWFDGALFDHLEHSQEPFTDEFREAAGFPKRRGQGMDPSSKGFRRSYHGRKLLSPKLGGGVGLALPNVFTGESRAKAKFVRSSATRSGFVNRYGLNRLNYKNPHTRVHPVKEFQFRLERQIDATVKTVDDSLERNMNDDTTTKTTNVR